MSSAWIPSDPWLVLRMAVLISKNLSSNRFSTAGTFPVASIEWASWFYNSYSDPHLERFEASHIFLGYSHPDPCNHHVHTSITLMAFLSRLVSIESIVSNPDKFPTSCKLTSQNEVFCIIFRPCTFMTK